MKEFIKKLFDEKNKIFFSIKTMIWTFIQRSITVFIYYFF